MVFVLIKKNNTEASDCCKAVMKGRERPIQSQEPSDNGEASTALKPSPLNQKIPLNATSASFAKEKILPKLESKRMPVKLPTVPRPSERSSRKVAIVYGSYSLQISLQRMTF